MEGKRGALPGLHVDEAVERRIRAALNVERVEVADHVLLVFETGRQRIEALVERLSERLDSLFNICPNYMRIRY